ncbi:MAG: hypothetical protein U9M94_01455 [Patescibacteria group bacterium]|nr:hypothetical protein [Patescibacteria group bacterium]
MALKTPVIILIFVVFIVVIIGGWAYAISAFKTDLPISNPVVNPVIKAQCEIDPDCTLAYSGSNICLPRNTSIEEYKCLPSEEAKEIEEERFKRMVDDNIFCERCLEKPQHFCECDNGKCEKVKIEAVEEVVITTDKMEYEIGETVEITMKSNTNKEMAICDPFYVIEKFDNGKWIEIKKILCPCGFRCTLVPYFILQSHKPREYSWYQTETWCDDSKKISEMISDQVPTGEYRVKSLLSDAKSAKICLVNSKTIYSNGFTIKEK